MGDIEETKEASQIIGKQVEDHFTGELGRFSYEMFKYGRTQNMIFERRPYQTKVDSVNTGGLFGIGKQDFTYNVLQENDEEKLITGPLFMGYLVKDKSNKEQTVAFNNSRGIQHGGDGGDGESQGQQTSQGDSNNINFLEDLQNDLKK